LDTEFSALDAGITERINININTTNLIFL